MNDNACPELDEGPNMLEQLPIPRYREFCPEESIVTITTKKQNRDQYARYIAEVTYKDINMSDYLVAQDVAKIWEG